MPESNTEERSCTGLTANFRMPIQLRTQVQCRGKSICLVNWAALGTGRVQPSRDLQKEQLLLGTEKTSLDRSSSLQPFLDLTHT